MFIIQNDLKTKSITRDKDGLFMIKKKITKSEIKHLLNIRISKYVGEKSYRTKGDVDKFIA